MELGLIDSINDVFGHRNEEEEEDWSPPTMKMTKKTWENLKNQEAILLLLFPLIWNLLVCNFLKGLFDWTSWRHHHHRCRNYVFHGQSIPVFSREPSFWRKWKNNYFSDFEIKDQKNLSKKKQNEKNWNNFKHLKISFFAKTFKILNPSQKMDLDF